MPNLCIIPARALTLHARGDLTPTDLIVLCAIGEHTDRNGEGCWAFSKTLAEKAGIGRSTFFTCADRLIEHGLVERESGKDAGKSSTYRIMLDARVSPERDRGVSRQRDTPRPASEIPPSTERDTPTINDPSNDPLNESSSSWPNDSFYPWLITDDGHSLIKWRGTLIVTSEHDHDLKELCSRIDKAGGHIASWLAEMAAAIDGMHGAPLTATQIGQAVRDFVASKNDISLRLFRGYLRDAAKPPRVVEESGRQQGKTQKANAQIAAQKLFERLKKARVQATTGVRVGHMYLPQNWPEAFTESEVEALKAVGTARLLSDDETTASIALNQLTNLLHG